MRIYFSTSISARTYGDDSTIGERAKVVSRMAPTSCNAKINVILEFSCKRTLSLARVAKKFPSNAPKRHKQQTRKNRQAFKVVTQHSALSITQRVTRTMEPVEPHYKSEKSHTKGNRAISSFREVLNCKTAQMRRVRERKNVGLRKFRWRRYFAVKTTTTMGVLIGATLWLCACVSA